MKKKNISLLGMHFLSFNKEGLPQWQGEIIGIEGDLCICQLYEWFLGEESECVLIPKMDFANYNRFRLFKNHEERNEAYQKRYRDYPLKKEESHA